MSGSSRVKPIAAVGSASRVAASPPLPRRWSISPAALYAGIVLASLLVGWIWVKHGGPELLSERFGFLIAIGQLTALYGTLLSLVGILLLSRAPWIDQVVGSDHAAKLHRWAGFTSVWLLVAHAVISSAGNASIDKLASPGQTWEEIVRFTFDYSGGLGGSVALVLFFVVAIVSFRSVRQAIPYETWYGIHLYVYLAMALGFLHQLTLGTDFINDGLARAIWIALYAVAFVPLLLHRFTHPIVRNLTHRFVVERVVEERPGVASIWIAGRNLEQLPVRAGQWFSIRVLAANGWWRSHPFSLSAGPDGRNLRFTIEAIGDRSKELQRLSPGTPIWLEGPYGILTGAVRTREKVLLVAGGIGVTPLRALIEVLPAKRGDLALLYRAPTKESLIFRRELTTIADARGARVDYALGSRDDYAFHDDPLSAGGLKAAYPDIRERDVYLCGSPSMMARVEHSLHEIGVPHSQIHLERFSW